MSNFQIHELTSGTIDRDSNVIHDTLNGGNYETRKATAGAVADLANVNVAALYDSATTYAIGQYCLYEGDIYRCIAITTGTFDSTKWTQIVVTGEFRRVVELTSAQYTTLSSAEKNNGTLYVITDEETTAADIPYSQGVSVADKLDSLNGKLNDYVKIITNQPVTNVTVSADTEYNSSSPITITGIPTGYKVIGVCNTRCSGYYGSRMVGYAWLESDTTYSYAIYNAGSRSDARVSLDVWFLCIRV